MVQMNHGHLFTIVKANLALADGDIDTLVNNEHVDAASLSEEDFCFG